jgi:ABC-type branched-subunit amino acid transport system substrate-binding protein
MNSLMIKRYALLASAVLAIASMGQALAQAPAHRPLTAQERRGKQIYLLGTSASGRTVTAFLGDPPTEISAAALTCVGCHGLDGLGRPEGGVLPSNIVWESLTKSYGSGPSSGRKHPPYTDRALELSLTRGLDPGGNRLTNAMPRYEMAADDLADLVAYLKQVGKERDPGLTDKSINIGTVIPAEGPTAEAGEAARALLAAYFDEVNSQGGVYGRKIELRFARLPKSASERRVSVERFVRDQQVFAMTGAFIAGAEKEFAVVMENEEVPLVGPFTLMPQSGFPVNRHVFYLLSGMPDQARALVNFARQKFGASTRAAILFSAGEINNAVVAAIVEQSKKAGWQPPDVIEIRQPFEGERVAGDLKRSGADAIFLLGTGAEGTALLKAAERLDWAPNIFLPGALSSRDLFDAPSKFKDKIFLSFPTLPSDQNKLSLMELSAVAEKHNLSIKHLAVQVSAYTAAKMLVEGLRLAGRELSREKLITALEGFYEFDTGLTPRMSFGPNRRTGASGAYVVTVDLEKKGFTPASEWIAAN